MRAIFKWAVRKKGPDGNALVSHNPARDVPYLKSHNPSGYHTWTLEEVRKFEVHHPVGSKARLALALLLFTGQRRSDITRLGRQHVSGSTITFTQFKGRNRKPKRLTLPILPVLQRIMYASPCGDMTFLVNELGRPFTDAGFGNWFHDRCVEAGVPGRAHGLRKAGATIAANNGATAHQLMAIFGWTTLKMAERYTREVDQRRLAETAMRLLEVAEQKRTEPSPTEGSSGTFSEKKSRRIRDEIWRWCPWRERDNLTISIGNHSQPAENLPLNYISYQTVFPTLPFAQTSSVVPCCSGFDSHHAVLLLRPGAFP